MQIFFPFYIDAYALLHIALFIILLKYVTIYTYMYIIWILLIIEFFSVWSHYFYT